MLMLRICVFLCDSAQVSGDHLPRRCPPGWNRRQCVCLCVWQSGQHRKTTFKTLPHQQRPLHTGSGKTVPRLWSWQQDGSMVTCVLLHKIMKIFKILTIFLCFIIWLKPVGVVYIQFDSGLMSDMFWVLIRMLPWIFLDFGPVRGGLCLNSCPVFVVGRPARGGVVLTNVLYLL